MHGKFSIKSDVFSFGVLILEVLTGRKNSGSYDSETAEDLLSFVSRSCCCFFILFNLMKLAYNS